MVNLWGVAKSVDKERIETKKKLQQICSVEEFKQILDKTMLSEEERQILWLYYKDHKSLTYIADILGMSESAIKRKHKKLLMKIGKLFV